LQRPATILTTRLRFSVENRRTILQGGFSMRLRRSADIRTVAWVTLAAALVVLQYVRPDAVLFVLPFSCYLAITCGVIAHNHNHCPTFVGRRLNNAFGHVLTLFYGYPTLMWIPTHNMNHHRLVNRPGDATITWRYTNKHNLFVALTYFFVSSYFQSEPIQQYIGRARQRNRHLFGRIVFQYAVWIAFIGLTLAVALQMHGLRTGLFVWLLAVFTPAICSLSIIMFFNYIQHVHADAWSEHDHSRNFTGNVFNFLFFNNGFHTAHHEHPALHWSVLPAAHAEMAASIDPRLNEGNLLWFCVKQYALAWLFPQFGTRQLGAEPRDRAATQPGTSAKPTMAEPCAVRCDAEGPATTTRTPHHAPLNV
jgi:fatty acid desaturase